MRGALRRSAFTLVELIVVISIVGLMAAMAIPRFAGAQDTFRADATARRIAADLDLARRAARSSSAASLLDLTPASHQYALVSVPDPYNPSAAYRAHLNRDPYRATIESFDLGGDTQLVFNGHGEPDSAFEMLIRCGVARRRIVLDPASGYITTEMVMPDLTVVVIDPPPPPADPNDIVLGPDAAAAAAGDLLLAGGDADAGSGSTGNGNGSGKGNGNGNGND